MPVPISLMTLRATTQEEIKQLNNEKMEWIKKRLQIYKMYDSLTRTVFVKAAILEMTDEETMTLLAYESLCALQEATQAILKFHENNLTITYPNQG